MAQKITGYVKLQIPAGKATPAPPVGPALGQHGVNIAAFTKEFNERTKNDMGLIIPVVITVYADRSFSFITKTPPAAVLIKKECNIESGPFGGRPLPANLPGACPQICSTLSSAPLLTDIMKFLSINYTFFSGLVK